MLLAAQQLRILRSKISPSLVHDSFSSCSSSLVIYNFCTSRWINGPWADWYHNNFLSYIFCVQMRLLLFVEFHWKPTYQHNLHFVPKKPQVRLCSGCTPRSRPTPESTSASFSDWPTFTHTWLITDLGSDKDFFVLSLVRRKQVWLPGFLL